MKMRDSGLSFQNNYFISSFFFHCIIDYARREYLKGPSRWHWTYI